MCADILLRGTAILFLINIELHKSLYLFDGITRNLKYKIFILRKETDLILLHASLEGGATIYFFFVLFRDIF